MSSLTLLFSAATAAASVAFQLPAPGILLTWGSCFGLLFAVYKFKNSALALPVVFALTGFMGGFLFAGMVIALIAGLGGVFLQMPALGMAVAAMVALLSAGLILFTSLQSLFGFGSSGE